MTRLITTALFTLTILATGWENAYAAQAILNYSKSIHGGGTLRVVLETSNNTIVSATAPTSVGDIATTFTHTSGTSAAIFALVGTQQTMTLQMSASSTIVNLSADFGANIGQIHYYVDTATGITSLASSTVSDCELVQSSSLYLALLELEAFTDSIEHHYKANSTQRALAFTVRAYTTLLTASTALIENCGAMNPHWAYGCGENSPNHQECLNCCQRWFKIMNLSSVGLGLLSLQPLVGLGAMAVTALEDERCREGCREAFPTNPPQEGQECGMWPFEGVCKSACSPGEHQGWSSGCSVAHICCVPD